MKTILIVTCRLPLLLWRVDTRCDGVPRIHTHQHLWSADHWSTSINTRSPSRLTIAWGSKLTDDAFMQLTWIEQNPAHLVSSDRIDSVLRRVHGKRTGQVGRTSGWSRTRIRSAARRLRKRSNFTLGRQAFDRLSRPEARVPRRAEPHTERPAAFRHDLIRHFSAV